MPPPKERDVLLEALSVNAMVTPNPPYTPVIIMELEDGSEFALYNVPYEIVYILNKIEKGEIDLTSSRDTIFDLLASLTGLLSDLQNALEYVVIDEIDYSTFPYTAKISINLGGIYMTRKMVPSHAIFLARLFKKPIYVSRRLVEEQELLEKRMQEESSLDEEDEEYSGV